MKRERVSFRHLVAGVGVLSLALVGFVGSSAAMAGTGTSNHTGNINMELTGSLTIHKHLTDTNPNDEALGTPLAGVVFQLQELTDYDLSDPADWAAVQAVYATQSEHVAPNVTGLTRGAVIPVTATNGSGIAVADNLPVGAYYVTEVSPGNNLITAPAIPFIITIPQPNADGTWDYNPEAWPKNDVGSVTPTKTAGDPAQPVGLGQNLAWTVNANLPGSTLGYTQFSINDSVGAGLTFVSWGAVSISGIVAPLTPVTHYTIDAATKTISFTDAGLVLLNGQAMNGNVTVTAVVNTTVTSVGVLTNTANITVNGTPPVPTSGTTNWAAIDITKVDAVDNEDTLDGAVFDLYAANPDGTKTGAVLQTVTTLADGKAHFDVYIGKDTVTTKKVVVVERTAPTGYLLPANPNSVFDLVAGTTATSTFSLDVENFKPSVPLLPLTGSTGTLLFTILGLGLVAAGGGLMVVRRTRSKV